ncbi:MAG TPA: hypothetical protein VFF11_11150, partial [Candidatus Binatia bacterium]|nr:hypothetical protein [Candidatus Binatia bacterium]
MNQNPSPVSTSSLDFRSHFISNKRSMPWIIVTFLLTLCLAHADPDSDYLNIYNVIGRADQLAAKGKTSEAHDYYLKAQQELQAFQQANPNWNRQILNYRFDYLSQKIAETAEQPAPAESKPPTAAKQPTAPAVKSPVKLLAAGSEPRTVLHLHPAVG